MKTRSTKAESRGITLIEVLIVLGVLLVLAALLLPAFTRPRIGGGIHCMSNQKQVALGFTMFTTDNGGKFPWQIQSANGSPSEAAPNSLVCQHFKSAAPYLQRPFVCLCPSEKVRHAATNFAQLADLNVSYFFNFDAVTNSPTSVLGGDRHLMVNGKAVGTGLQMVATNAVLGWTRELHSKDRQPRGFLSFTDMHVEGLVDAKLTPAFRRQELQTVRLAVP